MTQLAHECGRPNDSRVVVLATRDSASVRAVAAACCVSPIGARVPTMKQRTATAAGRSSGTSPPEAPVPLPWIGMRGWVPAWASAGAMTELGLVPDAATCVPRERGTPYRPRGVSTPPRPHAVHSYVELEAAWKVDVIVDLLTELRVDRPAVVYTKDVQTAHAVATALRAERYDLPRRVVVVTLEETPVAEVLAAASELQLSSEDFLVASSSGGGSGPAAPVWITVASHPAVMPSLPGVVRMLHDVPASRDDYVKCAAVADTRGAPAWSPRRAHTSTTPVVSLVVMRDLHRHRDCPCAVRCVVPAPGPVEHLDADLLALRD